MARAKRKEDLETAAVPSTPAGTLPATDSSSPPELAAQEAPFDPTFGFGTIMPMAMAQMSEAMSRFPGMDWVSRLQGKPPAALRIDQNRLMGLQAEYTQRTQQLLKMAASGDAP